MVKIKDIYVVLTMALFCLWAKTAQSVPSSLTTGKPDKPDYTQQEAPTMAAQYKVPETRHQNPKSFRTNQEMAPPLQQPIVQSFQDSTNPPQIPRPTSGTLISIAELERKDGVEMPPQIQKYAADYFNKMIEEYEMIDDSHVNTERNGGRVKRSYNDYGYGGDSYGSGYEHGYGNYGGDNYGHGASSYGSLLNHASGGGHGYGKPLYVPNKVSYSHGYTKSPLISFVKGFKPGKTYVDKGHVIRNYYRHGSYNVALQHYKLIPTVKVVPFTTYKKIGVGQKVEAKYRYKAHICKYCYHGYPKIDVYEMKKPYSYAVRRFVYLPKDYNLNGYHNSYGGDDYGNGGDSYGHGNGGDSYGYGENSYGNGGDSYGYGGNSYGNGGDSYGYGGNSYGNGGNSYGYGGNSYGYGGNSYGNGGDSYGYGGNSYGYGGSSNGGNSYGNGGGGYSGYGHSNGNGYEHGNGYGKAKVTYHDYYPQGNSYGYGNSGYGNSGYGNSGYGYHRK